MRVLHLTAADHGGAGTAAIRLHEALARAGVHSRMLVWSRRGPTTGVTALEPQGRTAQLRRLAARAWARLTTHRRYFYQDQRLSLAEGTDLDAQAVRFGPDLIVAHFLSNFLSFRDVVRLQRATGARIVWNLLDMGPLTGGCHYAWDCPGYTRGCGQCPALPLRPAEDASAKTYRDKAAALAGSDHVVVAASSTLQHQAKSSVLFRDSEIRTIHIGIDPADFPAMGRHAARARLDISHGNRILFFGAQSLRERRKGMHVLAEALTLLRSKQPADAPQPSLLIAGDAAEFSGLEREGFQIYKLGYVDRKRLALAYSAADFFLCPSLEDSGPMMVNESLMAGTPVIAFPIGVVPDLVISGETGLIAPEKTAEALAVAIAHGLAWDDGRLDVSRTRCRALAIEKCSIQRQVAAMLALARPASTPAAKSAAQ